MSDHTNPDTDAMPEIASLIESITEPCLITDRDSCILTVNPSFTNWLGYHAADLRGLFWTHYGPSITRPAEISGPVISVSSEVNTRVVLQSSEGTSHTCHAVCYPVVYDGQLFLILALSTSSQRLRGQEQIRTFLDSSTSSSLPEFLQAMTRKLLATDSADLVFAAIEDSPSERSFTMQAIASHTDTPSSTSCFIPTYDTKSHPRTITFTSDAIHEAISDCDLTNYTTPPMRGYCGYEFELTPVSPLDRPVKGHIGLLSQTPLQYSLQLHDSLIALGEAFQKQHKSQSSGIYDSDGEVPSIDAVIECDTAGRITLFNDVAENIFRYTRDEVIGRKLGEIIIPERYRDAHRAGLDRFTKERRGRILNTTIEIQALRKNGQEFPVELTVVPYESGGDICFRGTLRDITERWHNEELLRREQRRFQSLFDNSPVAIWEEDFSSLMQWMQQLRTDGITDFRQYLEDHPEKIQQAVMRIRILNVNPAAVAQNRANSREHLIDSFHMLINASLMRDQLLALWNGETIIEFESTSKRLDGERLDLICNIVIPVQNDKPEYNHTIFTGTDVTERRKSERDLERIRNHQALDKIGRLAGGIAHDFNNILTVILCCADLLRTKLQPESDAVEVADDIIEASLRAKWLTDELLTLSKRRQKTPVVVDVNSTVRRIVKLLTRVAGEQVDLICSTSNEPLDVRMRDGQLDHVLMNLVMNAKDAVTYDPRIVITTSKLMLTAENMQDFSVSPGTYGCCQVKDYGCGMTDDEIERAFQPFFTTKRHKDGTGLGLASASAIVMGNQGDIRITSQKGYGTTVDFILPILNETVSDVANEDVSQEWIQVSDPVPSPHNKQPVILVVDDEDEVREMVCNMLRGAGYLVSSANGGREALRMCNSLPTNIDLVLTDVMMPGMNGRQFAEQIRATRKEINILFMTGYDDSIDDSVMDATTLQDIIEKPFTARALLNAVKRSLSDRHP
jgi:two-component system cell cycle sensor histidine kinase/response regulator CckA